MSHSVLNEVHVRELLLVVDATRERATRASPNAVSRFGSVSRAGGERSFDAPRAGRRLWNIQVRGVRGCLLGHRRRAQWAVGVRDRQVRGLGEGAALGMCAWGAGSASGGIGYESVRGEDVVLVEVGHGSALDHKLHECGQFCEGDLLCWALKALSCYSDARAVPSCSPESHRASREREHMPTDDVEYTHVAWVTISRRISGRAGDVAKLAG
ncbi:hypothetical protein BD779DRAFT_1469070 [Infundibulicybe gibba]|nr:hypothetical protein BD779DRAFT_1469070 [Infundibulicybe gibba]